MTYPSQNKEFSTVTLVSEETVSGFVLLVALVAALLWSTLSVHSYLSTWQLHLNWLAQQSALLATPLGLIDNGAMTLFFFAIGLELVRERHEGALKDLVLARCAGIGAVGGMVGAAAIFLATLSLLFKFHSLSGGFGVPMATDVAFPLAVLSLLAKRITPSLRVFLLALAVVDDALSIVVLAIVSPHALHVRAWIFTFVFFALCVLFRRRLLGWMWVVALVVLWVGFVKSAIEPPLSGTLIALLIPVRSPAARNGERLIAPLALFGIVPLFVLSNLGIEGDIHKTSAPLFVAIVAARLVGKPLGILGALWLGAKVGRNTQGFQPTMREKIGIAILCAMGVTVPMVFAQALYANDHALLLGARLSLIVATVVAGIVGAVVLVRSPKRD